MLIIFVDTSYLVASGTDLWAAASSAGPSFFVASFAAIAFIAS